LEKQAVKPYEGKEARETIYIGAEKSGKTECEITKAEILTIQLLAQGGKEQMGEKDSEG